jgi:hypothetical protein
MILTTNWICFYVNDSIVTYVTVPFYVPRYHTHMLWLNHIIHSCTNQLIWA